MASTHVGAIRLSTTSKDLHVSHACLVASSPRDPDQMLHQNELTSIMVYIC